VDAVGGRCWCGGREVLVPFLFFLGASTVARLAEVVVVAVEGLPPLPLHRAHAALVAGHTVMHLFVDGAVSIAAKWIYGSRRRDAVPQAPRWFRRPLPIRVGLDAASGHWWKLDTVLDRAGQAVAGSDAHQWLLLLLFGRRVALEEQPHHGHPDVDELDRAGGCAFPILLLRDAATEGRRKDVENSHPAKKRKSGRGEGRCGRPGRVASQLTGSNS
jgi:hypothetical protein